MSGTKHCSFCGAKGVNMNSCPFLLLDFEKYTNGDRIVPSFSYHNPRGIKSAPRSLSRSSMVPRKKQSVSESQKESRGTDYTNSMKVQDLLQDKTRLAAFSKKLLQNSEDVYSEWEIDVPFDYRPYNLPYEDLVYKTIVFVAKMNERW